jgi:hypothetical protein
MTKPNDNTPITPPTEPVESERPTYEGSRLPWWIVAWFLVFLVFAVTYHILYAFPNLRLWLTDNIAQMWK